MTMSKYLMNWENLKVGELLDYMEIHARHTFDSSRCDCFRCNVYNNMVSMCRSMTGEYENV